MASTSVPAFRATFAGVALATAAATACAAAEAGLVADIYVDRATVLVFVPAAPGDAQEADAALARASAAQALSSTGACLARRQKLVQLIVADRIVLHDGLRLTDFDIAGTAPLTGVVLAAPRINPRVLYAPGGAESLGVLAPLAAAGYFHLACAP